MLYMRYRVSDLAWLEPHDERPTVKRDRMPVTPAVIRWAREQAGIPLADARERFGDIERWESGRSRPTYDEIEQLADQYKVPIAVFFFPEPPDLPPVSKSLRILPAGRSHCLPNKARLLIRRAKVIQLDVEELYRAQRIKRRSMLADLSFRIDTPIPQMTAVVRDYLGISIEDQFRWRDSSHALNEWRSACFRSGVLVIKDRFPEGGFNGFCLYDRLHPLIYVNSNSTYESQIDTLFHALAHLLIGTSRNDFGNGEYVDGMCLDFACEALVPSTELENCLSGLEPTEQTAAELASRFHVSLQLISHRFRDGNFISEAAYQSAIIKWNSQQRIEKEPSDLCNRTLSFFGRDYVGFVLSRHYADLINEEQLADYLDIRVKDLDTIESFYEQMLVSCAGTRCR